MQTYENDDKASMNVEKYMSNFKNYLCFINYFSTYFIHKPAYFKVSQPFMKSKPWHHFRLTKLDKGKS